LAQTEVSGAAVLQLDEFSAPLILKGAQHESKPSMVEANCETWFSEALQYLPFSTIGTQTMMKKPLRIFGLPCHRDSRWGMAISATKSVRRWGSGARRSDRGDRQANQINSAIQKYKPISDSEQRRR